MISAITIWKLRPIAGRSLAGVTQLLRTMTQTLMHGRTEVFQVHAPAVLGAPQVPRSRQMFSACEEGGRCLCDVYRSREEPGPNGRAGKGLEGAWPWPLRQAWTPCLLSCSSWRFHPLELPGRVRLPEARSLSQDELGRCGAWARPWFLEAQGPAPAAWAGGLASGEVWVSSGHFARTLAHSWPPASSPGLNFLTVERKLPLLVEGRTAVPHRCPSRGGRSEHRRAQKHPCSAKGVGWGGTSCPHPSY